MSDNPAMARSGILSRLSGRGILLCGVNVASLVIYLYFAHWSWILPGEEGLNIETSEPLIWNLGAFPILLATFAMDIAWLFSYLKWRPTRREMVCSTVVFLSWVVAVIFDFAHHPQ